MTIEGLDKEVEWEHVLSLGEQQRLGLARMYFHSPKFGVLVCLLVPLCSLSPHLLSPLPRLLLPLPCMPLCFSRASATMPSFLSLLLYSLPSSFPSPLLALPPLPIVSVLSTSAVPSAMSPPPLLPQDECTSAVSIDAEEQLYAAAVKQGITTITISQRNTVPEFHAQELKLGEDVPAGWVLEDIEEGRTNVVASGGFGGGLH